MVREKKIQKMIDDLISIANEMDDMGICGLSDHVDSIVDELQAEIQIEINKGAEVTFK